MAEALQQPSVHREVAASLMHEVIQEESRVVVSEGVNDLLQDYFETKAAADATKSVMTEILTETIPGLVKTCFLSITRKLLPDFCICM